MKSRILAIPALFLLAAILMSWGGVGHSKISQSAGDSFNAQMDQFRVWIDFLAEHSSDADYRKNSDPEEGAKHYIDMDNYPEFRSNGRIPQTLDSVIAIYGFPFVKDAGILPWATLRTFDTLTDCLKRGDWAKAQITAADLGHYVGDGHMPLHITSNYDGKQTGNDGIHYRYESTMIGSYINQISYTGEEPLLIEDMNQYVFSYLYENNKYVDSVLAADNYAKSLNANTSSTTYKQALWAKTKSFTVPLFKNASHTLASMIYTAWIKAGSPAMTTTGYQDLLAYRNATLEPNTPNPFTESTTIRFTLKENSKILLQVRDMQGTVVTSLLNDSLPMGQHEAEWIPNGRPSGIYYVVLNTGKFILVQKMIYSAN